VNNSINVQFIRIGHQGAVSFPDMLSNEIDLRLPSGASNTFVALGNSPFAERNEYGNFFCLVGLIPFLKHRLDYMTEFGRQMMEHGEFVAGNVNTCLNQSYNRLKIV